MIIIIIVKIIPFLLFFYDDNSLFLLLLCFLKQCSKLLYRTEKISHQTKIKKIQINKRTNTNKMLKSDLLESVRYTRRQGEAIKSKKIKQNMRPDKIWSSSKPSLRF